MIKMNQLLKNKFYIRFEVVFFKNFILLNNNYIV